MDNAKDVLLDRELLIHNTKFLWGVPLNKTYPHFLIIGASGSGKTYASTIILAKLIFDVNTNHNQPCQLILADYKSDNDFDFIKDYPTVFRFDEVANALELAIATLEARQKGKDTSTGLVVFFFDEWGAYLSSLDTKIKNETIRKLSRLMMLSRSFNIQIIIANQRGDAEYFGKIRDNFSTVLALGALSKETVQMFFSDEKSNLRLSHQRAEGYLKINGRNPLKEVVVPKLNHNDTRKCQDIIKNALESSLSLTSFLSSAD
ncbi:TPA: type IV secretory system conjugative DNA transfer family protein [Streptococcus agalactiae]